MHISGELVILQVLLGLDQTILEVHVELSSLVKESRQLLLDDDCLIELLEELGLLWIVTSLSQNLVKLLAIGLNLLSNFSLTCLMSSLLSKVLCELGLGGLENSTFVSSSLLNLH